MLPFKFLISKPTASLVLKVSLEKKKIKVSLVNWIQQVSDPNPAGILTN